MLRQQHERQSDEFQELLDERTMLQGALDELQSEHSAMQLHIVSENSKVGRGWVC
jgi:hypothetical protein